MAHNSTQDTSEVQESSPFTASSSDQDKSAVDYSLAEDVQLSRLIEQAQQKIETFGSENDSELAAAFIELSLLYRRRAENPCASELDQAINYGEMALALAPNTEPVDRINTIRSLANHISYRIDCRGNTVPGYQDCLRAKELLEEALTLVPDGESDSRSTLRAHVVREHAEIIEKADRVCLSLLEDARESTPSEDIDRLAELHDASESIYRARFSRTKSVDDLDLYVESLLKHSAPPALQEQRARLSWNVVEQITEQCAQLQSSNLYQQATQVAIDQAALIMEWNREQDLKGDMNRFYIAYFTTAKILAIRGSSLDFDHAVDMCEKGVRMVEGQHGNVITYARNELAHRLISRFQESGDLVDLERGMHEAELAYESRPSHVPTSTTSLLFALEQKFNVTRDVTYLDRAIEILEEDSNSGYDTKILLFFARRFDVTNSAEDLNRAIVYARSALEDPSADLDPSARIRFMTHLAEKLRMRVFRNSFETVASEDLSEAIAISEQILQAIDADESYHNWREAVRSLTACLTHRALGNEDVSDAERAVEWLEKCLKVCLEHNVDEVRLRILSELAKSYYTWFHLSRDAEHLDKAVKASLESMEESPNEKIDRRPAHCYGAALLLLVRYFEKKSPEDLAKAATCFEDGWKADGQTHYRLKCAYQAANLCSRLGEWERAATLLWDAVHLLSAYEIQPGGIDDTQHRLRSLVSLELIPEGMPTEGEDRLITQWNGVASNAAAVALQAGRDPWDALRLLELGRGVIAGSLLDLRSDISELDSQHPDLAKQLKHLRDELDASPTDFGRNENSMSFKGSPKKRKRNRSDVRRELKELLETIRQLSGFETFLLPPLTDQMMAAACLGPLVVLNTSPYRCDAFIVEQHRVQLVKLPLQMTDLNEKHKQLILSGVCKSILEWLWQNVASPVLDALGIVGPPTNGQLPHIWWIPTGPLCHFPIHAAGRHSKGSTDTVLDRAVSSYSPSIKALLLGRQHRSRLPLVECTNPQNERAGSTVVVAMKETPGLDPSSDLPFVTKEIDAISKLLPSLSLQAKEPARNRKDVLSSMHNCTLFHFAGHGRTSSENPSKSSLLLDDWQSTRLTVNDLQISRLHESAPFLAYLSACSTGTVHVDDLVDENIHLVSAFQLAGLRHVVGTLWEVSDEHCVEMARVFYETLRDEGLTDYAVALGVHRGVKALRDGYGKPTGSKVSENGREAERGGGDDDTSLDTHHAGDEAGCEFHGEGVEGGGRDARDVKLVRRPKRETSRVHPRFWAPYIHFGV